MTQQAVQERPATQPDTETPAAVETEALRGTDDADTGVQTGDEASKPEGEAAAAPDGRAARVSALAEAEREEERQRGRDEALAEIQQGTTQTKREQDRARLKQSFPTAQAAIDRVFASAKDEYGQPRALTEAEQTAVKNALAGHNLVALEVATAEVSDIVRDAVYAKLPKDVQAEFTKLTQEDTELPAYLDAYAETVALHTKAVKSLDLESALKHSAKLRKEIGVLKVAEYDAGYADGLVAPPGTSPDGGRSAQRTAPGTKSFTALEQGYADGTNTKEQDAEYVKQRDARAKAR